MTPVAISGWSAITSAGVGADALARQLASAVPAGPGVAVSHLYEEPLPAPRAHALADFDVRAHLGRRGTSSYDRATALAVVCCQDALAESGLRLDDQSRGRVGVSLGTSLGSFKSTSDYTKDTLVQDKPYLVNPMLFPNTVMNCAAGQVAIRLGLRGVNATIAGGALGFLNALRYSANVIGRGYADVMLTGAVEEYTPHRAWAAHLGGASVPAGEAAGVFVLTGPRAPRWAASPPCARILAVATGYGPGGGESQDRALAGCVDRVIRQAGIEPAAVTTVYTGEGEDSDRREYGPVTRVLGHQPRRVLAKLLLGECDAASGAVALAVALVRGPGELSLLTGRGADGAVGAAIVRPGAGQDPDDAATAGGACLCPP